MTDRGGQKTGTLMPPWPKGVSGNPGGRPRFARAPSAALAELNDTPGATPQAMIDEFRRRRGDKLCAADEKAIAAFKRDLAETAYGVTAFDSTTDRLEGKVPQSVKQDATLTIRMGALQVCRRPCSRRPGAATPRGRSSR